jgi:uncharacterized membrane protein YphA (DoxX/SURF4 family)
MKLTDNIIRFLVGGLFIFSGLIKLNDPIGTEIKLEEYFEVFSTDFAGFFHWFIPFALPIGMILIVLEVVIGIAALVNFKMKLTTSVMLGLIVFFTFLTFYSAYFDKVTDCGCFGDAIPLTPWESFTKDVILMIMIIYLFVRRDFLLPIMEPRLAKYFVLSTTVISIILGITAIRHLPFIDFRPYGVGDNIPANMIPEEQPVFEYTFTKGAEEVKSTTFLSEDEGYVYKSVEVTNLDKTIAKITDYNIWNEESGDYTQASFEGAKLFFISYDVLSASEDEMTQITELISKTENYAMPIGLTASGGQDFEEFRHKHQLAIPYFFADATVLKAMMRSNPGIMLLRDGTVLGKWHYNDVPKPEEVFKLLVE